MRAKLKRIEDRLKYLQQKPLPVEEVELLKASQIKLIENINSAELDLSELESKKK